MIRILLSRKLGDMRWTQADLARATGVRPQTVNEYYHELTDRINLRHFEKFCAVLDCPLEDILLMQPDDEVPMELRTRAGKRRGKKPEKK